MATLAQIYEVLVGLKVRDDAGLWHVYDADGYEITDPGGILLRGNLGALVTWPKVIEEIIQQGGGGGRRRSPFDDATEQDIRRLVQEKYDVLESRLRKPGHASPVDPVDPVDPVEDVHLRAKPGIISGQTPSIAEAARGDESARRKRGVEDEEALLLLFANL